MEFDFDEKKTIDNIINSSEIAYPSSKFFSSPEMQAYSKGMDIAITDFAVPIAKLFKKLGKVEPETVEKLQRTVHESKQFAIETQHKSAYFVGVWITRMTLPAGIYILINDVYPIISRYYHAISHYF